MESLSQKQRRFTLAIAQLIQWAYEQGYEFTMGDGYRDPRVFGKVGEKKGYGHRSSRHKTRLAHDLNLFIDGVYMTDTASHKPIGEKWESMAPDHIWGGRFKDGNHYEIR